MKIKTPSFFLILSCIILSCTASDHRYSNRCPIPAPNEDVLHELWWQERDIREELLAAHEVFKTAYDNQQRDVSLNYLHEHGTVNAEPEFLAQLKTKAGVLLYEALIAQDPEFLDRYAATIEQCAQEELMHHRSCKRDDHDAHELAQLIHQRWYAEPNERQLECAKAVTYLLCAHAFGISNGSLVHRTATAACVLGPCYLAARKANIIEPLFGSASSTPKKISYKRQPKKKAFFDLFD